MKWLVLIFALVLGGAYLAQEGEPKAQAAALSFVRDSGRQTMQQVGDIPFAGPGMTESRLAVFCAAGALAVGRLNDYYFGLNGHTSQWSDVAKVVTASGSERRLLKPTGAEFLRIGAIRAGADPLDYNRPISDGLALALERCGR